MSQHEFLNAVSIQAQDLIFLQFSGYVAVAGLPEPRKDHAIVMARFARDCLVQFTATVKAMVVELGPDTEELGVRIGLHSGPVTAG